MRTKQHSKYHQLSGQLLKLSTSILIGYQPKFFSIIQKNTKIAYKNLGQQNFQQKNKFLIKDVVVCQAEQNFSFTLETPLRTFTLKAKDQDEKKLWMRAITKIRKQIIRKKFTNYNNNYRKISLKNIPVLTSTNHSIPTGSSIILNLLNQTQGSIQSQFKKNSKNNNLSFTQRTIRTNSGMIPHQRNDEEVKNKIKDFLKIIPQNYVKYNIFVINLKSKIQNLFTASYQTNTYILISSKSLFPFECILDENLTNMMLPPWAQVNKMYKLTTNNNPKILFQVNKIIDIQEESQDKNSIKIRTQQNVHTFYCQTVEQKQRFKKIIQTAIDNFNQILINGKMSRKNYDKLIWTYSNKYDQFLNKCKETIAKYIPSNHQYEPQVAIKFIDVLLPFIQQFCLILHNKNKKNTSNITQIILHMLKQINQQVKIHIKLTWDTSYSKMKGQDILKFLNALAAYHLVIKDYLSDFQFMTGMKQLSKIYVRESWKNFEDIILGIVQQQKKLNIMEVSIQSDDQNEYIETNSIVDLFKFIYEVYELAADCWQHKLHLNNVQKLMHRAISVFISESKAIVDQTVIINKQLIGIANNYFKFSLTIDQFYNQKFSELQQKTKQQYDKLKSDYKQLSMIILDKLAFDIRSSIKKYFEKVNFYKIDAQKLYQIIKVGSQDLEIHLLHNLFIKRFYEKLFTTVRECILNVLEKQITSKKKHNVPKIIEQVDKISFDLIDISNMLYKGKPKIDKDLNEINILLSCENQNQIIALIKGSGEDIRNAYLNIIELREDYYVGGPLYYFLNDQNLQKSSIAHHSVHNGESKIMRATRLTLNRQRDLRGSFSSYYMMNDIDARSIVSKSDEESLYQTMKLISQGFLMKCKTNKKIWQKQYFRLKNGILFFYQNEKSQKCQNSIAVSQMINVVSNQALSFTINYKSLNRQKSIQLKTQTLQLKQRWIESLNLQLKRIKNDQKVNKTKSKLKLKQNKKNYLIIDYQQLFNGKGYFSYSSGLAS